MSLADKFLGSRLALNNVVSLTETQQKLPEVNHIICHYDKHQGTGEIGWGGHYWPWQLCDFVYSDLLHWASEWCSRPPGVKLSQYMRDFLSLCFNSSQSWSTPINLPFSNSTGQLRCCRGILTHVGLQKLWVYALLSASLVLECSRTAVDLHSERRAKLREI